PLSEQQERRLVNYLEEQYLELHQSYSKRHEPAAKLPTLQAYLTEMQRMLTLTLQVPPIAQSAMLRTSLLLRLTNTVLEEVPGYTPDSTDLGPLLKWLDTLDRGWLAVLRRQTWDSARGEAIELAQHLLDKSTPPTQTDRTRIHSLLVTGASALEDWIEGNNTDDDDDGLVHDMRRLGHQSAFDELFHRTLTELREL
ncbi:hypothetical protein BC834DRAFT_785482, partial [Gloeopeniophorella convolvens]